MEKVEIDVLQPSLLQTLIDGLLGALVVDFLGWDFTSEVKLVARDA
jgi:hypothetical protein